MIGNMEPMHCLHGYQADNHAAHERTYHRSVTQFEIDKVTRTNGNDTAHRNNPQQAPLYVEYHGKSHGSYRRRNGIHQITVMRHHTQFAELLVNHDILHRQQAHGYYNAEGHCTDHQHRIHSPHNAHLDIIVNHIIHKVYQRHPRNDEQCTRQQRMIGSFREPDKRRHIGQTGRNQCGNGNTHIVIDAELHATGTDAEAGKSADRGKQKRHPVTTEQFTETSAGKAGTDGNNVWHIVPLLVFDSFQFLLILVEGIVILNSPPGQFADFGNGSHVDAMLFTFLEFGERMQAVAHIHHQHGITYVDVELFFRQPQIGGNTVQVTNNTVCISRTLHQQLSGTKQ